MKERLEALSYNAKYRNNISCDRTTIALMRLQKCYSIDLLTNHAVQEMLEQRLYCWVVRAIASVTNSEISSLFKALLSHKSCRED